MASINVGSASGLVYSLAENAKFQRGSPECASPDTDFGPLTVVIVVCGLFSLLATIALIALRCAEKPSIEEAQFRYIAKMEDKQEAIAAADEANEESEEDEEEDEDDDEGNEPYN
eukprot:GILJ01032660.1.p1 GENE.GILJ01032660.1~~GILJ01032660.1.p1  ORF type:complete len:115 (+),score=27.77 GILJ01032660.1:3-347(+)